MTNVPDHIEDQKWITAAKNDIRHFEPLYKKYHGRIFRFIYRRTDDENLADDLCSQTFYKAMVSLPKYEWQGKPFISWLYVIALNEIKKHFRDKKWTFVIEEDKLLEHDEIRDHWLSLSQDKLIPLLNDLKDDDLQLIELKYFESQTFREIAVLLDMSESAVKMKLYRLLNKLRERLEVDHD
jgi:RNA polymerase sigma-70 factor (ECF subfamily)